MLIGGTPESGSQGRHRLCAAAAHSGPGGAPTILDGHQSPRRHAMAMLISLSHRDERDYGFAPEPLSLKGEGRSGLTAKRHVFGAPPLRTRNCRTQAESGAALGCAVLGAASTKNGPLAGDSQSARGPVHRTRSGRQRRRRRKCRRPNAEELRTRRSAARKGARDRVRQSRLGRSTAGNNACQFLPTPL